MDEPHFDWTELDSPLKVGDVIPILGRELLVVEHEGAPVLLDHLLGVRLAERLGVEIPESTGGSTLNAVAMAHIDLGRDAGKIYRQLHAMMDELEESGEIAIPEPLRLLARMDCFNLYVTTTFDSLLWRALSEERAEEGEILHLQYAMRRHSKDLPDSIDHITRPLVFSLFGTVSGKNTYVATEEDMLEVLHTLQEKKAQLPLLFEAFRSRSLLFIGCGYRDWLTRFFIRTVRNERLSKPRDAMEVVADERTRTDTARTVFLQRHKAEVYLEGDAVAFVKALYANWEKRRHKDRRQPGLGRPDTAVLHEGASDQIVFISYARQDARSAVKVRDALTQRNLSVFLDTSDRGVQPGDEFEQLIHRTLDECAVIVPLISRATEARQEGFFRKEWTWAERRREGCAPEYRLVQPLLLDPGIVPDQAGVPDGFRRVSWMTMEHEHVPEAFLASVQSTVRMLQAKRAGYRP